MDSADGVGDGTLVGNGHAIQFTPARGLLLLSAGAIAVPTVIYGVYSLLGGGLLMGLLIFGLWFRHRYVRKANNL